MGWDDVFKVITASLASVGVGGAIIFGLSGWLGKVWASRILEKERHDFSAALEREKYDLEILKNGVLRHQNDKLNTYQAVINTVAKILSALDAKESGRLDEVEADQIFDQFNEQRLIVYGYLAMLAPQEVMDAQDDLIDYLLKVSGGSESYEWVMVREKALFFINAIRKDLSVGSGDIKYNGDL